MARVAAGALGFLTLIQLFDGPDLRAVVGTRVCSLWTIRTTSEQKQIGILPLKKDIACL
jgi:hypothetical protein